MSGSRNAALGLAEGPDAAGPAVRGEPSGRGSRGAARRNKGRPGRFGIVIPAIGVAVVLVAIVTIVTYVMSPNGSGGASMATALSGLTHSKQLAMLEQERQEMVVMDAAANTLTSAASPTKVNPSAVMAAAQATSSADSSSGSSTGTSVVQVAVPNPGTAEQIGYKMLPSFGFNQTTQWSCLEQLWTRESGWRWDARNPDGAYGIPQAFPGSKMASAGSDWETDPATQIKWGLEYITSTYGTPCSAWDEEQSAGSY
ncbi:MAG TPA: hypothetical protein VMG38_00740 [Trebonia sp.]|nr:hypothetical protein [Trebonia sp.]